VQDLPQAALVTIEERDAEAGVVVRMDGSYDQLFAGWADGVLGEVLVDGGHGRELFFPKVAHALWKGKDKPVKDRASARPSRIRVG
jgi:hypothetical protein